MEDRNNWRKEVNHIRLRWKERQVPFTVMKDIGISCFSGMSDKGAIPCDEAQLDHNNMCPDLSQNMVSGINLDCPRLSVMDLTERLIEMSCTEDSQDSHLISLRNSPNLNQSSTLQAVDDSKRSTLNTPVLPLDDSPFQDINSSESSNWNMPVPPPDSLPVQNVDCSRISKLSMRVPLPEVNTFQPVIPDVHHNPSYISRHCDKNKPLSHSPSSNHPISVSNCHSSSSSNELKAYVLKMTAEVGKLYKTQNLSNMAATNIFTSNITDSSVLYENQLNEGPTSTHEQNVLSSTNNSFQQDANNIQSLIGGAVSPHFEKLTNEMAKDNTIGLDGLTSSLPPQGICFGSTQASFTTFSTEDYLSKTDMVNILADFSKNNDNEIAQFVPEAPHNHKRISTNYGPKPDFPKDHKQMHSLSMSSLVRESMTLSSSCVTSAAMPINFSDVSVDKYLYWTADECFPDMDSGISQQVNNTIFPASVAQNSMDSFEAPNLSGGDFISDCAPNRSVADLRSEDSSYNIPHRGSTTQSSSKPFESQVLSVSNATVATKRLSWTTENEPSCYVSVLQQDSVTGMASSEKTPGTLPVVHMSPITSNKIHAFGGPRKLADDESLLSVPPPYLPQTDNQTLPTEVRKDDSTTAYLKSPESFPPLQNITPIPQETADPCFNSPIIRTQCERQPDSSGSLAQSISSAIAGPSIGFQNAEEVDMFTDYLLSPEDMPETQSLDSTSVASFSHRNETLMRSHSELSDNAPSDFGGSYLSSFSVTRSGEEEEEAEGEEEEEGEDDEEEDEDRPEVDETYGLSWTSESNSETQNTSPRKSIKEQLAQKLQQVDRNENIVMVPSADYTQRRKRRSSSLSSACSFAPFTKSPRSISNRSDSCESKSDTDLVRTFEKREKNRVAAQKCRHRQQCRMEGLSKQIDSLESKQERIKNEIKRLQEEKEELNNVLKFHFPTCRLKKPK